jgi:hypothetical protein
VLLVTAGCEARGKAEAPPVLILGAWARGRPVGSATRGRTHWSERVDWRFDEYRRRSSGPVLVAWPRPDVRRWCSRRGSKHQAKAQGRPFHSGATGERQIGRVKNLNLWLMSRYGQLRRWDVVAEPKDWPLGSGRRWLGSPPSREEHRRPRDTGGTHPGRNSCARNAVTPVGVRAVTSGEPTVRKAQPPGGNLMIEKRRPAVERQQETGTWWAGPFSRSFRITGRIPGLEPGRESVLTRSGEPVRRR